MKLSKEDLENIEFLYQGYLELLEKAKKKALEDNIEFLEKEGSNIEPEKFIEIAMKKGEISPKYKSEINRYKRMILNKISEITNEDLSNANIIKFTGIPKAKKNKFEIKKNNKKELILIDKDKMLVEIIKEGKK